MSDNQHQATQQPKQNKPRRRFLFATLALATGLGAAATAHAVGGWHGPGGWHGRGFMNGPIDPAEAGKRAERMIKHIAVEVDATREQQDKLVAIVKSTLGDLLPLREQMRGARQKAADLLTRPTIDRAALEALRLEQIKLADTASKRAAQALGDAADVLTPAQRLVLKDRIERIRGFRRPWHRG